MMKETMEYFKIYILTPTGHGLLSLLQQLSVIFLIFISLLLYNSHYSIVLLSATWPTEANSIVTVIGMEEKLYF